MKTQRQSPRLALRLSAMEATRWCRLGFQVEDDFQDQRGASAEQISQIDDAADCADSLDLTCMKCDKRVSVAQHLHNLSPLSLYSMIEVSAEAWHATLYLITPWQYLPRLAIRRGLACYSTSCRALAVCAEAWHAFFPITPWQYQQRFGILFYTFSRLGSICRGLVFYSNIFLRLGSICRGLAFYSISFYALAVSAEAWLFILYLIKPWQYLPRLGMAGMLF